MEFDLDFMLDDDHKLFLRNVREFCQTELAPGYLERAKKHEFDMETYKKLADFGLLGFMLPEEYGSQGDAMDFVAMGLAVEEGGGRFQHRLCSSYLCQRSQIVNNYAPDHP